MRRAAGEQLFLLGCMDGKIEAFWPTVHESLSDCPETDARARPRRVALKQGAAGWLLASGFPVGLRTVLKGNQTGWSIHEA